MSFLNGLSGWIDRKYLNLNPDPQAGTYDINNPSAFIQKNKTVPWFSPQPRNTGKGVTPGAGSVYQVKPTTTTTTSPTTSSGGLGSLATPGFGEEFYTKHMSQYDQPTNAEQYWNSWAGSFNSPGALDTAYDREGTRLQNRLTQRLGARGIGDSSAASRATADLGLNLADRKIIAQENFAKTGMGLAGDADAGKYLRIGAGQNAANTAEQLNIQRQTGALSSAMGLGNAMANTVVEGLNSAENNRLNLLMQQYGLQMQMGNMDYNTAMQKIQEQMALGGTVLTAYQLNKIGAGFGGSGGLSTLPTGQNSR